MEPHKDAAAGAAQQAGSVQRKPYVPPTLRIYGDVATLTRSKSTGGKSDGGHGAMSKTT